MTMGGAVRATTLRGRPFASPRARALALAQGIELEQVRGSGPDGRVVVRDLAGQAASIGAQSDSPAARPARPTRYLDIPNSIGRQLIARRLTESARQAPQFHATVECCVDPVLELRAALHERLLARGVRLSLNDFVLHAAAQALREVPQVNVAFSMAAIRQFEQVHLAVAVDVPGGLVTPVIADADSMGVARIASEMGRLIGQARDGTLPAGASAGGTFSVSSLGSLGVQGFTALLNPPQAAILAVGAAEKKPAVRHDQLVIASLMCVTLGCDHRAIDGALAARWLKAFKRRIENPREEDVWR